MKTRAQRHSIYKKVLAWVKKNGWQTFGFCGIISKVTDSLDVYDSMKDYPELVKRRPEGLLDGDSEYWFQTFEGEDDHREEILRQVIKETKPKVSYEKSRKKGNIKSVKRKK